MVAAVPVRRLELLRDRILNEAEAVEEAGRAVDQLSHGLYCGREVDGCPLRISRTEAGRVCESQGLSAPPTLPPAIDAYLLS